MENKVLKTSNFEKIVNSLEGENIKRGIITRITKDADIIVTLNEELEGVGRETYLVVIPASESILYVPKHFKTLKDNTRMLEYMSMYIGSNIPFIVQEVEKDDNGTVLGVKASMKLARDKSLERLEKMNLPVPRKININILGAVDTYLVAEWEGMVQTISARQISHAEIPSVREFISRNKLGQFMLTSIDYSRKSFVADRCDVVPNKFLEKVYEKKLYRKGDHCLGIIRGKTASGLLIIEVEPEIMGIANMPNNLELRMNEKITCEITGFNKKKNKIMLGNIRKQH
ncbi:hypothetical protein ACSW9V_15550 (plasmid) [Clostridium perfringens]|uniref:hypothetical protein n=1 Tax=Clostridium perfringens TaxID=1502 RepID=UPI000B375471|nr:hypothetical protein [Clostridium perfringens]EGT0690753.1 hypothetical protein [Clostridium perfringens]EGT0694034.1 hypothetical protein [Clostridium perfringens]EGT0697028.1 hypothetical protein [Clostridium perfringens]MDU3376302.1 hypothetical protein [Clostridium perfringens]MDU3535943.1 hypothetical protein [Clostridium perfringens]